MTDRPKAKRAHSPDKAIDVPTEPIERPQIKGEPTCPKCGAEIDHSVENRFVCGSPMRGRWQKNECRIAELDRVVESKDAVIKLATDTAAELEQRLAEAEEVIGKVAGLWAMLMLDEIQKNHAAHEDFKWPTEYHEEIDNILRAADPEAKGQPT